MAIPFLLTITEAQFKELLREAVLEVTGGAVHSPAKEVLDIRQAAEFTKLAIATLYDKTSQQLIPHYKVGTRVIFKKEELIAWIEKGKMENTAAPASPYPSGRKYTRKSRYHA